MPPIQFVELEVCYGHDWDTTVNYRLQQAKLTEGVDEFRIHSILTPEWEDYLESEKITKTEHFIERVVNTGERPNSWLTERYDMKKHTSFWTLRKMSSWTAWPHGGTNSRFAKLSWQLFNNDDEIRDELNCSWNWETWDHISWETQRYHYGDELRVDFINWGDRGRFGAYAVVTIFNPNAEQLKLWSPCASKYVAVIQALRPDWLCLDSADDYARNSLMLQKAPWHSGQKGRVESRWPSFPDQPPMNAAEAAAQNLSSSDCSDSENDSY
jgi:hypothetical protein